MNQASKLIEAEKIDELEQYLKRNPDLVENRFLIDLAVDTVLKSRSVKILQSLLNAGWNINNPARPDRPPFLGKVAKEKDEILIQWFLDHGADPNEACLLRTTPLSWAVQFATPAIVQHLFDNGGSAEVGYLMNHAAARRNTNTTDTLTIMELLVEKGAPVDRFFYEDDPDLKPYEEMFGQSPLMIACGLENIEAIQFLLAHGADPTRRGYLGSAVEVANSHGLNLERIREGVMASRSR